MRGIIQTIHNLGLALWWGGTFMATLAMNPAVEVLDDPDERDKMVDEGWALFQPWAAGGLLGAIIAHIALRRRGPKNASIGYKTVASLKDLLFGAAVVSTFTNMAMGEYVIHDDSVYPVQKSDDQVAEVENNPCILTQQGLTPAACVQLLTGVALFAAGAFLAVRNEQ